MTTLSPEDGRADEQPATASKVRMTQAMREGLDALQREYAAFVESSRQTLALVHNRRCRKR